MSAAPPNRDVRQMCRMVKKRLGYRVDITGSGHVRLTAPDSELRPVIVPSSPSDYRWKMNLARDARRAGHVDLAAVLRGRQ
jgi:hypothetical protein